MIGDTHHLNNNILKPQMPYFLLEEPLVAGVGEVAELAAVLPRSARLLAQHTRTLKQPVKNVHS